MGKIKEQDIKEDDFFIEPQIRWRDDKGKFAKRPNVLAEDPNEEKRFN